jgi:hypothetical protein
MIMELGSTHEPIIEVAKAGVLLALEHNMLPKPILQEALRWALTTCSTHACSHPRYWHRKCVFRHASLEKRPVQPTYAANRLMCVFLVLLLLQAHLDGLGLLQSHQPAPAQAPAPPAGAPARTPTCMHALRHPCRSLAGMCETLPA